MPSTPGSLHGGVGEAADNGSVSQQTLHAQRVGPDVRIAALITEAFGGHGGIALYNRNLLTALCDLPGYPSVRALPRLIPGDLEKMPERLDFRAKAACGIWAYLMQVARLVVTDDRFDLVICGHINLLPLAEIVRKRHKAPLLLFIHGVDAWHPTGRLLSDWLAKRSDAVVSVSETTGERFTGWTGFPPESLFVLPNAIDLNSFAEGSKPTYLEERYAVRGKKILMTLGRLIAAERYKGIDEVLELLPEIAAIEPQLRFLVVGDGDDRPRLQEKAASLGLAARVIFAGRIPEQEKADHYRLADAFVMAGRGEGFGFVFLEAMACGIPVLASKLDGSREALLDGRLGLLADPNDRAELKQAILQVLARPKGIPAGLDYFGYARYRDGLRSLIAAVIAGARRRP